VNSVSALCAKSGDRLQWACQHGESRNFNEIDGRRGRCGRRNRWGRQGLPTISCRPGLFRRSPKTALPGLDPGTHGVDAAPGRLPRRLDWRRHFFGASRSSRPGPWVLGSSPSKAHFAGEGRGEATGEETCGKRLRHPARLQQDVNLDARSLAPESEAA
jgi:hypothetical protein